MSFVGPREQRVKDGNRRIDSVVVELDVGVDPGAGEAVAVELDWASKLELLHHGCGNRAEML